MELPGAHATRFEKASGLKTLASKAARESRPVRLYWAPEWFRAAQVVVFIARDAALHGCDSTDYRASASARSFVPFYAQKISSAIVMNGMQGILD